MINKELKNLYKKFSYFEEPNLIKNKVNQHIKEYEEKVTLNKHKNIVKGYKIHKNEIQNQIETIEKNLKYLIQFDKMINNYLPYGINYLGSNDLYKLKNSLFNLKQELNKLEIDYSWSKYYLREYIKQKTINNKS
ncbi:hypothetical protein [Clostridium sp.]|uniref:hypothetical protein n=1 Tax=Clostridium sp. TaxID=1506 RepID=UPI00261EE802|nr:hypothetical protein [Clostridium sp.]